MTSSTIPTLPPSRTFSHPRVDQSQLLRPKRNRRDLSAQVPHKRRQALDSRSNSSQSTTASDADEATESDADEPQTPPVFQPLTPESDGPTESDADADSDATKSPDAAV